MGGEVVGPAEEDIRYDGHGGGRVGLEPFDDRIAEFAQGSRVSNGAEELGVNGGDYIWRREEERLDGCGGMGREERVEERKMRRGDQYGNSEATGEEHVGEVKEGDDMPQRRVREDEDVCAVALVGGGHGFC